MSKVIGIDLGTTNSCVAVMEGEQVTIITNAEGGRTTPSVVAFTKKGERLVGEAAKRQMAVNAERTVTSIKREMGSKSKHSIDGKSYSPQEISAMILQKLKKDAENYLGESVSDAVITVPAYFDDSKRQATKDAGRIAGLNVLRIINEPTAAALSYGLDNSNPQKILVYDLGGGTFDVSVIEIGDSVTQVLATAGDNHLGGDDFDERLTDYLIAEFKKQTKLDLRKDVTALTRVREAAEKAKKELSYQTMVNVNLPFLAQKKEEPVHMDIQVTREQFEKLTYDLVDKTAGPVKQALTDAGIDTSELGKVLLVGGSTRIPAVQTKVKKLLGMEPSKTLNPDECVAIGAAIQGEKLSGNALICSKANEILLMDVTPLSLSIETVGGVANRILERNSPIPTRESKIFTTAGNFQTSVEIKVYQGERRFTRDNKLLGNFMLTGIKRARAGVPQIEVTFNLDANGILNVSAKDLGTGKQQEITITSSSNLSEAEIERARTEAARYEQGVSAEEELMEIRNEAEALVYRVDKLLAEQKKNIDKKERKLMESDLAYLKKLVFKAEKTTMTAVEAGNIRDAKEQLEKSAASYL